MSTKGKITANEDLRDQKIALAYRQYGKILSYEIQKHYIHDPSVAEDIVQSVFERVLKYGHGFADLDDQSAFRFLYEIMKNETYVYLKKQNKYDLNYDINDHLDHLSYSAKNNMQNPEFLCVQRLLLKEVARSLPSDYSIILELHYRYGYKYNEIADILGLSENAVNQKCFYIRKRLKELLIEKGYYEKSGE